MSSKSIGYTTATPHRSVANPSGGGSPNIGSDGHVHNTTEGNGNSRGSGDGEVILSTKTSRELVKEVATLRRRLQAYDAQEKALLVVEEGSGEASTLPGSDDSKTILQVSSSSVALTTN